MGGTHQESLTTAPVALRSTLATIASWIWRGVSFLHAYHSGFWSLMAVAISALHDHHAGFTFSLPTSPNS